MPPSNYEHLRHEHFHGETEFERAVPSFKTLFRRAGMDPSCLSLTKGGGMEEAARIVAAGVRHCDAWEPQVLTLLGGADWRPHIVGGVAVALGGANERTLAALYGAMDASWVSPQLAVIASLVDPVFEREARRRIETCCPSYFHVRAAAETGEPAPPSDVPGGGRIDSFSAKLLLALAHLCREHDWLPPLLEREDIRTLLARGRHDDGGRIAAGWGAAFVPIRERVQADGAR